MVRIAVEGLIGVGKSTVMERLQHFAVRPEPIASWTLLPQFYKQRGENALAFELQVLCSYCHEDFDAGNIVMERSPDSALGVFVPMLVGEGSLDAQALGLLHAAAAALPLKRADAFVYICAPAHVCMQRLAWRNRSEESRAVTAAYLAQLEAAYANFFATATVPVETVLLDGTETPEQAAVMVASAIQKLQRQLETNDA